MNLSALNAAYGITNALTFEEGQGGLPVAVITTVHGKAIVSLYGAHVLSYTPAGKTEALWMSTLSAFEHGKPIRGGIPVCFPWFGPHATDAQKPQHGFARLQSWDVTSSAVLPDGSVELRLALIDSPSTQALWPHAFAAEMTVTVGTSLTVVLHCANTGTEPFTYSDALHTYLAVSDISSVKLQGLAGSMYYEGFGTVPNQQNEEYLAIRREENRRYVGTDAECVMIDSGAHRNVRIAKTGSRVTVVWNPWAETAKKLADMPDTGYSTMLCVEAVNAYDDEVTLQPGQRFSLGTTITVE